jgi:hypothetical protein
MMHGKKFRAMSLAALLGGLAMSVDASAETGRPWMDPPADLLPQVQSVAPTEAAFATQAASTSGSETKQLRSVESWPPAAANAVWADPSRGGGTSPDTVEKGGRTPSAAVTEPGESGARALDSKSKRFQDRGEASRRAARPRQIRQSSFRNRSQTRGGPTVFAKIFGAPRRGANVITTNQLR